MATSEPSVQMTPEQAAQLAKLDALASRPQLPTSKAVLQEAWTLFRANVWLLLGLSFLGFLPMALVPLTFIGGMAAGSTSTAAVSALLMFAIALCIAVWSGAASLLVLLRPNASKGVLPAFAAARPYVLPFLWVAALQSSIIFGGIVLFLIGSAIFSIWTSFAPLVLIDEDVRGMRAIVKSRELVRGRAWRVAGYFVVVAFAFWIAGLVFSGIPALFGGSKEIVDFFNSIFSVAAGPFAICYQVVLYRHVKATSGDVGVVPKPGQAKWYWMVACLGPIMLALILSGALAAYRVQSQFYGDMIGQDELRKQLEAQYADFENL